MIYTVDLKQTLRKTITIEAVSEQDAIVQALACGDCVIDTDDIETEVVSIGHFVNKKRD